MSRNCLRHSPADARWIATLLLLLGGFAASGAQAVTMTWVNPAGGNWSNPANWSTGVPGPLDDAVIAIAGTYTVTLDVDPTVASLTIGGASGTQILAATGRTLTLNGASAIGSQGRMTLTSTIVGGTGSLTNNGLLTLSAGTINVPLDNGASVSASGGGSAINGALLSGSGSLIVVGASLSNSGVLTVANGFTNNGTITLRNSGGNSSLSATLNVTSGTLVNAVGRLIEAVAGSNGGPTRNLNAQLDNQGTLSVGHPLTINGGSADHISNGLIDVSGGNLTVTQSGTTPSFTNTGPIAIASGRTMTISGGALIYDGGVVSGAGTLAVTSNIAILNVDFSRPGTSNTIFTTSTVNGPGDLINNSSMTFNGATINAPGVENLGTLSATATSVVNGAFTTGSGSLIVVGASLSNSGVLTVANGFTNNGTITLRNSGGNSSLSATLNVTSGTLVNAAGRLIEAVAGSNGGPTRNLNAQLDNQGTLSVGHPLTINGGSADHISNGLIDVSGGNLTVTQSGTTPSFTNTGPIAIASGRTMTISGGALLYDGGVVSGAGTLAVTSNIATLNVDFSRPGTSNTIFTTSTVNGPGDLINNSSMTFNGATINAPGVENLGTLSATATSVVSGAFTTGSGSLIVVGASLSSSGVLTVANGFTNNGTITLRNSGGNSSLSATLNVTSGTLVNAAGRLIEAVAGSNGGPTRNLNAQLDNQGTLTVGYPLTVNKASANHASSGLINVSGGNLTFAGSARSMVNSGIIAIASTRTLTSNTGGTTFTNAAAGVIRGTGTLSIGTTFTNHGTMVPGTETTPGVLSVTGTYVQTTTAVLAIDLGGLIAGAEHDRLNVSGPVTLAGTIGATLISGFAPTAGNTFTVLTHGARTGTFGNFANGTGSCFEPHYNSGNVTLDACACLPPTISSSPVSTAVCSDHHSVLFTVIADGTAPLAYQWRKEGIDIAGANAATFSIGLANFTDAGDYDVVVTNDCGQEVSSAAVLTILPEGPDITEQPATTAACIGSTDAFTVAAEAHMGGALSYQWRKDGEPIAGATAATLLVSVGSLADGGQYDCVVTEAGCGSATSHPGVLTVKNDPPVITLAGPADVTIECPDAYTEPGATVDDDCDTGLAVVIGGEAVDGEVGVYVVTYDATDSQGNHAAQVTRVVRVRDVTPPTISLNGPATMLLECHAEFEDPGATAMDSCDPAPVALVGGDPLDVNTPGTYVLTYRAKDQAENESPTVSRTIEVQDTTPPEITLVGETTVTVECAAGYEELGATVEDACDPAVTVTIGGDVVDEATLDSYVVTYSATDGAGNPATTSRTVEVVDSTPPVLAVDPTPIFVTDLDCSGTETVVLPAATAEDLCDATPIVTHDAPGTFAPGTRQVTFTARDDAGNEATATVDVTVGTGARIEVLAAQHTVGQGNRPSTTKAPLAGILVGAYERGQGSCSDQQPPTGHSWQDYPAIVANCTPVNTSTTDATGRAVIDLPPGDYVIISHLVDENTYIGEWANDLACGEMMTKRLQLIVANNTPRAGKTTRLTGSELLIIEPEYVIWDDSTQVYPFVLESVGSWGVTASVAPPDGFVADHPSLSAQVQSEIEAVQFTITEVGSDLVPTRTTFQVIHGRQRHTVRSEVGLLLTPDYARARGFNVAALEGQGLIVHPGRQGSGGRGRFAGAPEQIGAQGVRKDRPKVANGPDVADSDATGSGAAATAHDPARTADGKWDPTWAPASVLPAISGRGLAAWPSPFSGNGALQVAFGLPEGSLPPDLELGLFDVLGRRVATIPTDLALGRDGVARLAWGAEELRRGDVAPGVYFLRAFAPSVGMQAECKLVVTR